MRTNLKALLTILSLSTSTAAIAAPPPSAWTFEVDTQGAGPHTAIPYRLAWTNHNNQPIRVPADLLTTVEAKGHYEGPARLKAVAHLSCNTTPAKTSPGPTHILQPQEALQRIGTLEDFFDQCVDGCTPGTYTLNLSADGHQQAPEAAPEPSQPSLATVDPFVFRWSAAINTRPPTPAIAIAAGPNLKAILVRADPTAKTVKAKMRLTIANNFKQPIYFPPAGAINVAWSGHETTGTGGSGWQQGRGGQSYDPWGPDTGTLVGPGQRWTITLDVDGLNKDADHAWVTLHFSPGGAFEPAAGAKTPFYFAGAVQGLEAQLY